MVFPTRTQSLAACLWLSLVSVGVTAEIGFIEDFSLAPNRAAVLQQLIPGSEDHYYYQCLQLQQIQQFEKVADLLQQWTNRHGRTPRVIETELRQALLTYERNPQQSLEAIRRHLNLEFNHQRENLGEKPNLPSELDPQLISRERLTQDVLTSTPNLDGFEDSALDWLVTHPLDPDRRRLMLQRLQRPGYASLVKLVVDDLNHQNSGGFGSLPIHGQLLLAELDECLKLHSDLLNHQHFVQAYLSKLAPSSDTDWRRDAAERERYLDRVWSFVSRLAPAHNSLKAHVLYHRLGHDRAQGLYDKQRFLAYIQLPRNAGYLAAAFAEREENRRFAADLNADFSGVTGLPPVRNDEPLVREYLQHFLVDENSTKPYEPFINDVYLRHQFAETKIVNGLGNPEQWYSLLPPEQYQALKERIDLDFVPTNRLQFAADEAVAVDLLVKNVSTLIVKVFEINTLNFYRQNLEEVNTDINLDGLVANDEQTVEYGESPLRRVRRHFDFPNLTRPGVYVIDFIGNGMSSRVVVRKGGLRHLVRSTTAGHVFTVLDDRNQLVKDAKLWLSGREYTADESGEIVVPFSDQPGPRKIVLSRPGTTLCSLGQFLHEAENYTLNAGIYVDRESLLSRRPAQVLIRPSLLLNGIPVTLSVLEDVRLQIVSRDYEGVATSKEVSPFELLEDREATLEFQTPPRLSTLAFTLTAKVQNLSQNKKVDLSTSQSFALNSIDKSDRIEDLYLARIGGGYVVELLGKSGEARPDRPVRFQIKHRDFRQPIQVTLKSDERGRIQLGALADIASVTATGPEETTHSWPLRPDQHSYYSTMHGAAGQPLSIPYIGSKLDRSEVSLLEFRGGTFVADRFDQLALDMGMLTAKGLAAGDYDLWLKRPNRHIALHVAAGKVDQAYVLGSVRHLELRGQNPLQIAAVETEADNLRIRLQNAGKFSRVHLLATRYEPEYDPFGSLARVGDAEPARIRLAPIDSLYVVGRNIGDEYRYILDRKFAKKFPGVMLDRPSVLLNPWAVRSTQTAQQEAQAGEQFAAPAPAAPEAAARSAEPQDAAMIAEAPLQSNLDFLANSSVVASNLVPGDDGVIVVPRERLGAHQHVHVLAVDPVSTAYRSVTLPESPAKYLDLRLAIGLDPLKHFTQQKHTTVVAAEGAFELPDLVTSKFEVYDTLARAYRLLATLSSDAKLAEFGFITNWPSLKPAEKQAKYSQFACHELSFFLYKKDPKFFSEVVKPYLANKRDKTFLDRWLLELPLEADLDPWAYSQLNIVERILLSQQVAADAEHGVRHVRDLFDLLPTDIERSNLLFRTAIRGSVLETNAEAKNGAIRFDSAEFAGRAKMMGGLGGAPAAGAMPQLHDALEAKEDLGIELKKSERLRELAADDKAQLERRAGRAAAGAHYFGKDRMVRGGARQLFEQIDKTQEWAENNYYKLTIEQQNADLVTVNRFWHEFARHDRTKPFLSASFPEASRNFTEMMLALTVLDLPFEAGKHESKVEDVKLSLRAGSPLIVFHEEIRSAGEQADRSPILVGQNFFQAKDRFRYENNEQLDKFVTEEFLVHTVYGCQVVITNPGSSPQKLDVLTQIPVGAIAVQGGEATRGLNIRLEPFSTQTIEYFFYFPAAGKYPHYPVHVSKNEQLLVSAEPFVFNVVEQLSRIDRESWEYLSQHGTNEQVVDFLRQANLQRLNLEKIAFRMREKDHFLTVVDVLRKRHAYNHTLWSYGIRHQAADEVGEFLQHATEFIAQCGDYLDSPVLKIDPIARHSYQHLDYLPLVNARAHQLGRRRQILNDRFAEQYHHFLKVLGYKRELSADDRLAVTYYLLLQDRIDEATGFFRQIDAQQVATRVQYDYFAAYLALCHADLDSAEQIVMRYTDYPVDRWRNRFRVVASQIDEAQGAATDVVDPENRDQVQSRLAATEPTFEFQVESQKVTLRFQNLERVVVNYYLMDIELLFSRNPFVQTEGTQFAHIRANLSQTLDLPLNQQFHVFDLPEQLRNSNVLIEIRGGGQTRSQAYFANSLNVQVQENYGQVRIGTAKMGQPLPKVYVKVYARMKDGAVRFYKDGYTDLRGRFEYATLNTNELEQVDRFGILILSDEHGAVVREARPPQT